MIGDTASDSELFNCSILDLPKFRCNLVEPRDSNGRWGRGGLPLFGYSAILNHIGSGNCTLKHPRSAAKAVSQTLE